MINFIREPGSGALVGNTFVTNGINDDDGFTSDFQKTLIFFGVFLDQVLHCFLARSVKLLQHALEVIDGPYQLLHVLLLGLV